MFAVSSRCKNDSQLCFKCLHCLDSQITVLLQWYVSVFVLVHANNDFMFMFLLTTLNTHFIWSFSVAISFKQSKRAWNIDNNGHWKKKQKGQKTQKNVLKQQKTQRKKNTFLHLQCLFTRAYSSEAPLRTSV